MARPPARPKRLVARVAALAAAIGVVAVLGVVAVAAAGARAGTPAFVPAPVAPALEAPTVVAPPPGEVLDAVREVARAVPSIRAELRRSSRARTHPRAPLGIRLHPTGEPAALGWPLVSDAEEARALVTIEPATPGQHGVLRGDTLWFRPDAAWVPGKVYRVRVAGVTGRGVPVEPATFELRTPLPGEDAIEPGGGANVVLSFDDGPGRGRQAHELLDVLLRERVRAILFPTSDWTRARPEWLARARGDGHLVCNHTETHRDLRRLGDAELRREIAAGHGHDGGCALLRPPMRGYDERVARVAAELGYRLFLWHVDTRDWEGATAEEIEGRVLAGVRPGAVVLFHIQADATLAALPAIVARLRRAGYVPSYDPQDLGPGLFALRDEPTESAAATFALTSGLGHAPGPAWWAARP